jgi:spoIIIJ-associated protein
MALKSKELEFTRVNIDIAEYKKHHQDKIADMAVEWMQKVKETGEPMHLKPMNPADRRVVHKVASEYELETHSEGEGRDRHVVLTKPETSE